MGPSIGHGFQSNKRKRWSAQEIAARYVAIAALALSRKLNHCFIHHRRNSRDALCRFFRRPLSGKLLTVPFNVAIPDFTETPMSALCKLGSHASSVVTARCTFRSFSCVSLSDFFVG